ATVGKTRFGGFEPATRPWAPVAASLPDAVRKSTSSLSPTITALRAPAAICLLFATASQPQESREDWERSDMILPCQQSPYHIPRGRAARRKAPGASMGPGASAAPLRFVRKRSALRAHEADSGWQHHAALYAAPLCSASVTAKRMPHRDRQEA